MLFTKTGTNYSNGSAQYTFEARGATTEAAYDALDAKAKKYGFVIMDRSVGERTVLEAPPLPGSDYRATTVYEATATGLFSSPAAEAQAAKGKLICASPANVAQGRANP